MVIDEFPSDLRDRALIPEIGRCPELPISLTLAIRRQYENELQSDFGRANWASEIDIFSTAL